MTIIIAFVILSFIASVLVVAALMLSSRLSQREGVQERYESGVDVRTKEA